MTETKKVKKPWKNVIKLIAENKGKFAVIFTKDKERERVQFFFVYILLTIIGLGMSVINYLTAKTLLMYSTLVFAGFSFLLFLLSLCGRGLEIFSKILLAVGSIVYMTFFIVSGEPEGFSVIWVALLPIVALLLYKGKIGSVLSAIMFIIVIFLFWTEFGHGRLEYIINRFQVYMNVDITELNAIYSESMLLRFPLLYLAFFMVGLLFEIVRTLTYVDLQKSRDDYKKLSNHDVLTGLYNRFGFNEQTDKYLAKNNVFGFGLAIIDLDDFKNINDTYGHPVGDLVLKKIADTLLSVVGDRGVVCRWGGEEFAIFFNDVQSSELICSDILKAARNPILEHKGEMLKVTCSIGLVKVPSSTKVDAANLVNLTDKNLYESKNTGKNKITISYYY